MPGVFWFFCCHSLNDFLLAGFPYSALADIRHEHICGYFKLNGGLHTRVQDSQSDFEVLLKMTTTATDIAYHQVFPFSLTRAVCESSS